MQHAGLKERHLDQTSPQPAVDQKVTAAESLTCWCLSICAANTRDVVLQGHGRHDGVRRGRDQCVDGGGGANHIQAAWPFSSCGSTALGPQASHHVVSCDCCVQPSQPTTHAFGASSARKPRKDVVMQPPDVRLNLCVNVTAVCCTQRVAVAAESLL